MANSPGPVMELLGRVAFEVSKMRPLMPTYLHLLLSAIFPIYTAAHASLARPSSAVPREKKAKREDGETEDEDAEVVQKIEGLTPSDAIMFPLLAGSTLASLYLLLRWLKDPEVLNRILAVYFSQMGLFFGAKFLKDVFAIIRSFVLPTQYSNGGKIWKANDEKRRFESQQSEEATYILSPFPGVLSHIPLPNRLSSIIWDFRKLAYTKATLRLHIHKIVTFKSPLDVLDVISFILATLVVAWNFFISKPWYLTNFLGFSFCYGSMQYITPTTGWTGTLVLCALFVYDIYFVFFTPMMVTVATKLDVPIKLLFPRPDGCVMPVGSPEGSEAMQEYLECLTKKRTMAMLGLGDIVIPGMMLAFALRFDLYLFYLKQKTNPSKPVNRIPESSKEEKPKYLSATGAWGERFWTSHKHRSAELQAKNFPKPYFYASAVGYLAGMVTTVVVMQVAGHAQPALLYLVPGVLVSIWGSALVRGDIKMLWNYTEDSDEVREHEKKEVKKADKTIPNVEEDKDATVEAETLESKPRSIREQRSNNENKAKEASCRHLIHFEVLLPSAANSTTSTKKPRSRSTSTSTSIPKPDRIPVLAPSKPNSNSSSSNNSSDSYDILTDVHANHVVLDKLSMELTREREGEIDGGEGPPEKRRRKA